MTLANLLTQLKTAAEKAYAAEDRDGDRTASEWDNWTDITEPKTILALVKCVALMKDTMELQIEDWIADEDQAVKETLFECEQICKDLDK